MTSPTVIVVGAGAMGLATGRALVRAGARTLVLERFERGHLNGASHGATRNFNDAYSEDAYLDLLVRAHELWDELSADLDEPLLRLHGLLTHGRADNLVRIHAGHQARGIASRLITGSEASARWPGMRFEDVVLHSTGAGVARADAALLALERDITLHGGRVQWSTPVADISETAEGVRVRLASGEVLEADAVVVTAGAWTRRLVPESIALPALRVTEEHPAHFAPTIDAPWPSFNHHLSPERWPADVYGMPTPGEGVKVGFHLAGREIDPDNRPHDGIDPQLSEYVREWFPGLDADTFEPVSCTYTTTPTSDFILDRVGRVVIGAGFSGHGFKFTPAVGEVLASLALDPAAPVADIFRR